ncbi:MAG: hypothetical protein H0W73_18875 [Bacteroidetes bacterium]|nr:hypothetical protein [Bacteroidota bacterium]
MKKTIITIVAFVALAATSCKKDYTCECVKTGPNGSSSETTNTGKMKLDEARAKCNDGDKSETVLGSSYTTDCSLK